MWTRMKEQGGKKKDCRKGKVPISRKEKRGRVTKGVEFKDSSQFSRGERQRGGKIKTNGEPWGGKLEKRVGKERERGGK